MMVEKVLTALARKFVETIDKKKIKSKFGVMVNRLEVFYILMIVSEY